MSVEASRPFWSTFRPTLVMDTASTILLLSATPVSGSVMDTRASYTLFRGAGALRVWLVPTQPWGRLVSW